MDINVKSAIRNACRTLLRPVASILLRAGMTWKEFSELSKGVFVSVATNEFGIRGRPTNVSRVSILTGISRKEITRQRKLLAADEPVTTAKTTDATRILSGWYQDESFNDTAGNPLPLPVEGPIPSFKTLFDAYGGDTPAQTMIKELVAAGSAEMDDAGLMIARRRYHMPANLDVGNLHFFGDNLFDHAQTLRNNLANDGSPKRLEGFAVDTQVNPDCTEEFREFVDKKGQQFLEEIDDWLALHRIDPNDATASPIRLGLGMYAVEGPLPKGTSS